MYAEELNTRLWDKVLIGDGCWEWIGAKQSRGYGQIYPGFLVHRVAYEQFYGPIPKDKQIDHLCCNKICVRPDHLEVVDRATNLNRRKPWVQPNSLKTHCLVGHPFDEANTYWATRSDGRRWRQCRACVAERMAGFRAKKGGGDGQDSRLPS